MFRGSYTFDQLSPAVKNLIVVNVVVFLAQMILPNTIVFYLGLTPQLVITKGWVWQLVTYAFLHGSGWHLFFNMFALWMFGPSIESYWGTKRFLVYYGLCVLGAAAAQCLVAPNSMVVGASGAIYGLLLAFAFLMPDAVLYLFFVFPVRAMMAVLFIALFTLASAIGSGGSRIAHFSHLGGMLVGFFYFKIPQWWNNLRLWKARRQFEHPKGRKKVSAARTDLSVEVDRILEKISSKGVNSLTDEEHRTMQQYAKEKQ
jgi:membrane associated rhomboid family serine protease